jgi:hypothetical protein
MEVLIMETGTQQQQNFLEIRRASAYISDDNSQKSQTACAFHMWAFFTYWGPQ